MRARLIRAVVEMKEQEALSLAGELRMDKTPEQLYKEREARVEAAIHLKIPDRVPVMCRWGFFPAKYRGAPSPRVWWTMTGS